MKIIKNAIKELKSIHENNNMQLVAIGEQSLEDWSQETASEELHYKMNAVNYVLKVNDLHFVLTVRDEFSGTRYRAMEDEWIDDGSVDSNVTKYLITPYYIMNQFENVSSELSEVYTVDHKNKESDLPIAIKKLADELKELASNSEPKELDGDFDADYEEFLEELMYEMKERKRENPDMFFCSDINPMEVKSNVVFDIQLSLDGIPNKASGLNRWVDLDKLREAHSEFYRNDTVIEKIKDSDMNIDVIRNVNNFSNKSGIPESFLIQMDNYNNMEVVEMYHMMLHSEACIDAFSKSFNPELKPVETPPEKNTASPVKKERALRTRRNEEIGFPI